MAQEEMGCVCVGGGTDGKQKGHGKVSSEMPNGPGIFSLCLLFFASPAVGNSEEPHWLLSGQEG